MRVVTETWKKKVPESHVTCPKLIVCREGWRGHCSRNTATVADAKLGTVDGVCAGRLNAYVGTSMVILLRRW